MVDRIEDSDVRRVDQNVDPTALTDDEIADAMPDDFSSSAKDAFAQRVAQERSAVPESVDLSKRIGRNPANNAPMIKNEQGQFAAAADRVEDTTLDSDGGYYAELDDGSRVRIETVDLDAGSREGRSAEW